MVWERHGVGTENGRFLRSGGRAIWLRERHGVGASWCGNGSVGRRGHHWSSLVDT